jgi:hypothetical protein
MPNPYTIAEDAASWTIVFDDISRLTPDLLLAVCRYFLLEGNGRSQLLLDMRGEHTGRKPLLVALQTITRMASEQQKTVVLVNVEPNVRGVLQRERYAVRMV